MIISSASGARGAVVVSFFSSCAALEIEQRTKIHNKTTHILIIQFTAQKT
jgi:hypothetical protein